MNYLFKGWFRPACSVAGGYATSLFVTARDQYEAIFGLVTSNVGLRVLTSVFFHPFTWMGSGFFYYDYEAHKEYDDVDVEETTKLGTIKICRYHFKDEMFSRSVHSRRFHPNRPYEFPIAMLSNGGNFGEFRPTPSATIAPPQMAHTEPTLTLGPPVPTYPPCRRCTPCVPRRSMTPPSYPSLSRSWMGGGDIEKKEDNEMQELEPEEDLEKNPEEDQEKSKEENELKSMHLLPAIVLLNISGQQLICQYSPIRITFEI
ncbi:hypothetical protein PIB30_067652 [Stylosanthes scabra]|uniref:Uncharacterized protein n=1 Tax=Stylosanthes scabra TaxID=79078 RepID=A0ABU6SN80_9FABA|nr:hypothetical protein [Stylosanthes scabra]